MAADYALLEQAIAIISSVRGLYMDPDALADDVISSGICLARRRRIQDGGGQSSPSPDTARGGQRGRKPSQVRFQRVAFLPLPTSTRPTVARRHAHRVCAPRHGNSRQRIRKPPPSIRHLPAFGATAVTVMNTVRQRPARAGARRSAASLCASRSRACGRALRRSATHSISMLSSSFAAARPGDRASRTRRPWCTPMARDPHGEDPTTSMSSGVWFASS